MRFGYFTYRTSLSPTVVISPAASLGYPAEVGLEPPRHIAAFLWIRKVACMMLP